MSKKKTKIKSIIPTNEQITAELCSPEECLSPGRGLFSKDVLDQIIKADNATTFMWELVKIIESGIDSSFYKVHIGVKAFELIKQFLVKYEDTTDNSIYYLSELSEIKNTKFVIDNKIESDLAIIKHDYNKEKL